MSRHCVAIIGFVTPSGSFVDSLSCDIDGSVATIYVKRGLEIRCASDEEEKGPVYVAYLVKLRGRGREGARNP